MRRATEGQKCRKRAEFNARYGSNSGLGFASVLLLPFVLTGLVDITSKGGSMAMMWGQSSTRVARSDGGMLCDAAATEAADEYDEEDDDDDGGASRAPMARREASRTDSGGGPQSRRRRRQRHCSSFCWSSPRRRRPGPRTCASSAGRACRRARRRSAAERWRTIATTTRRPRGRCRRSLEPHYPPRPRTSPRTYRPGSE